jgi:hypothetical protein
MAGVTDEIRAELFLKRNLKNVTAKLTRGTVLMYNLPVGVWNGLCMQLFSGSWSFNDAVITEAV